MHATSTITTGMTTNPPWNGAVCATCSKGYLGTHTCAPADLLRKAADLIERAGLIERDRQRPAATMTPCDFIGRSCPCRPENGGSGVCGCILSGPQVTC